MFRVPKRFRMDSGVKFLDIVEDSLFGTLQRTGGFHFERNGCGSEQQRVRDGNAIMRLAR